MSDLPVAYPSHGSVNVDTSELAAMAQRSPGVIAVVGSTPNGASGGTAEKNKPYEVSSLKEWA